MAWGLRRKTGPSPRARCRVRPADPARQCAEGIRVQSALAWESGERRDAGALDTTIILGRMRGQGHLQSVGSTGYGALAAVEQAPHAAWAQAQIPAPARARRPSTGCWLRTDGTAGQDCGRRGPALRLVAARIVPEAVSAPADSWRQELLAVVLQTWNGLRAESASRRGEPGPDDVVHDPELDGHKSSSRRFKATRRRLWWTPTPS